MLLLRFSRVGHRWFSSGPVSSYYKDLAGKASLITEWGNKGEHSLASLKAIPSSFLPECQKEADGGCVEAQTLLGHALLKQDRAKSMFYLHKASAQHNPIAAFALAECYAVRAYSEGEEFTLTREAAKRGFVPAQLQMAELYASGSWNVKLNLGKTRKYLEAAAKQNSKMAISKLATLLASSEYKQYVTNSSKNNKSVKNADIMLWNTKAAEMGDGQAMFRLAQSYLNTLWSRRDDVPTSHASSEEVRVGWSWLQRAAEAGHLVSMYNLAVALEQGHLGPPDPKASLALLEKIVKPYLMPLEMVASSKTSPNNNNTTVSSKIVIPEIAKDLNAHERGAVGAAMCHLMSHYEEGKLLKRDILRSLQHCKSAVMLGHVDAAWRLALWYVHGIKDILDQDLNAAKNLTKVAAGRGNKQAENALKEWDTTMKKFQDFVQNGTGIDDTFRLPYSLKETLMRAAADGDKEAIKMLMQAEEGESQGVKVWMTEQEEQQLSEASTEKAIPELAMDVIKYDFFTQEYLDMIDSMNSKDMIAEQDVDLSPETAEQAFESDDDEVSPDWEKDFFNAPAPFHTPDASGLAHAPNEDSEVDTSEGEDSEEYESECDTEDLSPLDDMQQQLNRAVDTMVTDEEHVPLLQEAFENFDQNKKKALATELDRLSHSQLHALLRRGEEG